jgi:hypothetical protein
MTELAAGLPHGVARGAAARAVLQEPHLLPPPHRLRRRAGRSRGAVRREGAEGRRRAAAAGGGAAAEEGGRNEVAPASFLPAAATLFLAARVLLVRALLEPVNPTSLRSPDPASGWVPLQRVQQRLAAAGAGAARPAALGGPVAGDARSRG